MLLDLMVKLVVDYQDVKLIPRDLEPGKHCEWNNENLYRQQNSPKGSNLPIRGFVTYQYIPLGDDYVIRIKVENFVTYERSVSEYYLFYRNTRFQDTPIFPSSVTE